MPNALLKYKSVLIKQKLVFKNKKSRKSEKDMQSLNYTISVCFYKTLGEMPR